MWGGIISRGLCKNSKEHARCAFEQAEQSTVVELVKCSKVERNDLELIGDNHLGRVL